MMLLFGRSIRFLFIAVLLAVTVISSFGLNARYSGPSSAAIMSPVHTATELTGAHPKCQHAAEHSHEVLPSIQNAHASSRCASSVRLIASDRLRLHLAINPIDPPPRA